MGLLRLAKLLATVSITGARSTSTPERITCVPHALAYAVSDVSDQVPCVRAVGMREKPGPWRTCTYPPSWSEAMNSGTPAVAAVVVKVSARPVRYRTGGAPAVVRPVRMRLPTWYRLIAVVVAEPSPVTEPPTMKSCPTRCAVDIRL